MTRHWRDLLTDFVLEVLCVEKVNEASNVFWSTDITEVTRMNQHITRWQLQTSCEAVGVRNAHKPKKKSASHTNGGRSVEQAVGPERF